MRRLLALLVPSLCFAGCLEGEDSRLPGDSLGTFRVVATLESSSCGPGALGSPELWEFDVQLSRESSVLYWLNGEEAVGGNIASDGRSFSIESTSIIDLAESRPGVLGCSIGRRDTATGTLDNETTDVPAFTGSLAYGYVPLGESDCSGAIGVEGGFAALPCEIRYTMTAKRTEAPED